MESAQEYLPIEDEESETKSTPQEPVDRFSLAWFLFMVLGAGILFPWNCFLSEGEYWGYLFPDFPQFFFVMSLTSSTPNLIFLMLSTFYGPRFSFGSRTLASFATHFVVLILVPIAGSVLSSNAALAVILGGVFLQGCATATLYGSVLGLASLFPPRYIGAIMSGNGVAGIFTILLRIITKVSLPSNNSGLVLSAMIFFGLAAFLIFVCIVSYIILSRLPITRYYVEEYQRHNKFAQKRIVQMKKGGVGPSSINSSDSEEVVGLLAPPPVPEQKRVSMFGVLKAVWREALNVWMVFFVTLALFPGVTTEIGPKDGVVGDTWFQIFMMGLFMLGDYIGRTLPRWIRIPGPQILWLPSVARFVFFPLLIMTAKDVLFHHDAFAYIFMLLFALTNGYYGTLAMMYGPVNATNQEKEIAGTMMSFFLQFGIFMGSSSALLLSYLIFGISPF